MSQPDKKPLPIGYWLKHVDEVITQHVNKVLSANGFNRFQWQLLNTIFEAGTITKKDVFAMLKTFIDSQQLDEFAAAFAKAGWLQIEGEGDTTEYTLTEAGKAQRETIFIQQSEVRKRTMQGISEQEYQTVIDVLQRMAKNLE